MRRLLITTCSVLLLAAACGEDPKPDDPCAKCADGEGCVDGSCIPPAPVCTDGVRNGQESDVDCGGEDCAKCAVGKGCAAASDCASGLCEQQVCAAAPTCDNGVKDGAETDVDCGGGCAACANGKACAAAADCVSGLCQENLCAAPAGCENAVKDGPETDVDCGGGCPACADNKACAADGDCASGWCDARLCKQPNCTDGVRNGNETGVDCGGACEAGCAEGAACAEHSDCLSGLCVASLCAPPRIEVMLDSANDALSSYLMDADAGAWNIFSGATVKLGRHWGTGHVSYHTALRFKGVMVPPGATITDARLSFHTTNEVDSSKRLMLNVYAEKKGDSVAFDPTDDESNRPDQRLHTSAFIDRWIVRCNSSCTDLSEYDCPQRKLDCWDRTVRYTVPKNLKALAQEVVSLDTWAQGNAMTFILSNGATEQDGANYQDSRDITGFDVARGAGFSPKLTIEWAMPTAR